MIWLVWALYKNHAAFVLGFHGCDAELGEKVLAGKADLRQSVNDYDWLGSGTYFWEGSPARAFEFAQQAAVARHLTKGSIGTPFVLGAVIDLGHCCNLLDADSLDELLRSHDAMCSAFEASGTPVPENSGGADRLRRHRDRAAIEFMHTLRSEAGATEYQTVRAAFQEGELLYENAGFSRRAHIQIAVRDPSCIKGYFRPIQDGTARSVLSSTIADALNAGPAPALPHLPADPAA